MELSIIVPVYNEEALIEENVHAIVDFFSARNIDWELIVVDDGSSDSTVQLLETAKMNYASLKVVSIHHQGKGSAVREGCMQSKGDWMLFFDIDLSTPLLTFDRFWKKRGERTVLIGSRELDESKVVKHQWWAKEYAGKLGNILTRLLLPLPYKDTQCGFKMFPGSYRQLLPKTAINGAAFDIEWLLIAKENGYDIEEVPVEWTNREESKFTLRSYGESLGELWRIYFKELKGEYKFKVQNLNGKTKSPN
ncbi:MAG: glycosyltransferase [Patescibacteria group bacterium]